MPRNEQQNGKIRDSRMEQILNAALHVFARRGMVAAKVSDIAKEAGLSHGLVYHYFKSKEEVFTTLVQIASDSSMEVIEGAMMRQGSSLEKLHWMTDKIISDIAHGGNAILFLIMIQASTSEAVPEKVKQMLSGERSPVNALVPLLIQGQQAGEIVKDDPVTLAVTYFALVQGLAMNKMQWDGCPMPQPALIMKLFAKK